MNSVWLCSARHSLGWRRQNNQPYMRSANEQPSRTIQMVKLVAASRRMKFEPFHTEGLLSASFLAASSVGILRLKGRSIPLRCRHHSVVPGCRMILPTWLPFWSITGHLEELGSLLSVFVVFLFICTSKSTYDNALKESKRHAQAHRQ